MPELETAVVSTLYRRSSYRTRSEMGSLAFINTGVDDRRSIKKGATRTNSDVVPRIRDGRR